ncbi:Glycosyltransferase-like domain-containing protein 1 [Hypsibius exemplaris]|uniref:tRNA-queuosine alpha-mannosyltransferase n=1 Tax=Hypsibius exemplaris TaxID=2072580 RepID=A0A9X6NK13_HYPEX|nr:Glycosyltransferase-like domain-containing protein 1 [Hypsibius exemplaris]
MSSSEFPCDAAEVVRLPSSLPAATVLLIEPFYGGSHRQLMDFLAADLGQSALLCATPAKKWHWVARVSALHFAQVIPEGHCFRSIFASSVLNLAELMSLRPDLAGCRKILYFHENQLVYPAQEEKERDFQYGYNQILSALVADINVFNSQFNLDSFLENIDKFLAKIPTARPKRSVASEIRPKCRVIYFPLNLPSFRFTPKTSRLRTPDLACKLCNMDETLLTGASTCGRNSSVLGESQISRQQLPLHIVWPHRWEHDKNPDFFVSVLEILRSEDIPFRLSVVGEQFSEVPDSFQHVAFAFGDCLKRLGYLPSKEEYFAVLMDADVVVSTANHEFFGAAMLEAVHFGCYPLAPRRLVYPELYPDQYLYDPSKLSNLVDILRIFCLNPSLVRSSRPHLDVSCFSWPALRQKFLFS